MTRYVLGFLFDDEKNTVVLIKKNKPVWQKGLLNGVGGKIEEGELPIVAMVREFEEETSVKTDNLDWKHFAGVEGEGYSIACFYTISSDYMKNVKTMEEEVIEIRRIRDLQDLPIVSNLLWLVHLAKDENNGNHPTVQVKY